jgi:hypothetical protein
MDIHQRGVIGDGEVGKSGDEERKEVNPISLRWRIARKGGYIR